MLSLGELQVRLQQQQARDEAFRAKVAEKLNASLEVASGLCAGHRVLRQSLDYALAQLQESLG